MRAEKMHVIYLAHNNIKVIGSLSVYLLGLLKSLKPNRPLPQHWRSTLFFVHVCSRLLNRMAALPRVL